MAYNDPARMPGGASCPTPGTPDALIWLTPASGTGTCPASPGVAPGGQGGDVIWARLTASDPGNSGLYSWKQVTITNVITDTPGGLTGTYSGGGSGAAKEVNGLYGLHVHATTGTVVQLQLNEALTFWLFDAVGPLPNIDIVYTNVDVTYASSTIDFVATTVTFDTTSTLALAGPAVNVTDITVVTVSNNQSLTLTGNSTTSLGINIPVILCDWWSNCYDVSLTAITTTPYDLDLSIIHAPIIAIPVNASSIAIRSVKRQLDGGTVTLRNSSATYTATLRHMDATAPVARDKVYIPLAIDLPWPPGTTVVLQDMPSLGYSEVIGGTAYPPVAQASGTNHSAGLVPDPGATPGTAKYLREDMTWVTPTAGLTGSGTTNYIPVWTGSSTLGDSLLAQDAAAATVSQTVVSATLNPVLKYVRRQAADANCNPTDVVGSVLFVARCGGTDQTVGSLTCYYSGTGTDQKGSLALSAGSGLAVTEQLRLTSTGVKLPQLTASKWLKTDANQEMTTADITSSDVSGLGTVATLAVDTDGTLAANSDTRVATQKATKTYVDNAVTGLFDYKGGTDCSGNPNYPAASKGDAYTVTVAGKIGGASGKSVDVGDVYIATADNAGGTEASVGTSWIVVEHNLVGALLAANNLSDVQSPSTARTNLGLVIGTNVQAWDADLDALAALSGTNTIYYRSASNTWSPVTVMGGLSFVASNLGIGDAAVGALVGLSPAADRVAYYTGATTAAITTLTSFGRSLIDDTDASAARTTLGLGSIATQASNSVSITGGTVSGITDLAVADGGTGASDAATARTNLGLAIGTNVQAYDAELSVLAGLTFAADSLVLLTSSSTATVGQLTNAYVAASAAIDLSKLQSMTAGRLVGRTTASAGSPTEITPTLGVAMSTTNLVLDVIGPTTEDSPDIADNLPFADASASNATRKTDLAHFIGAGRYLVPGGRLSLTSGTPATSTDTSGGTVYYMPYIHDRIVLWDGTRWVAYSFSEVSVSLSGATAGDVYDVFGYVSGGALTLEKLVWTNTTTRATAITIQDGRYCKSGDKTRLYLGSLRISSTSTTTDSTNLRYLWNMYNRVPRALYVGTSSSSWTYTTATVRQAEASNQNQVDVLCGLGGLSMISLTYTVASLNSSAGVQRRNGIGEGSTTSFAGGSVIAVVSGAANEVFTGVASLSKPLLTGHQYYAALEYSVATGTSTWYGNSTHQLQGLSGWMTA